MMKADVLHSNSSCCTPGVSPASPKLSEVGIEKGILECPLKLLSLAGGWFSMGSDTNPYPQDGEAPERQVFIDPFSISATAITNLEFGNFVAATGYQTVAEEVGWSFVFHMNLKDNIKSSQRARHAPWWCRVDLACWSSPEGVGSNIASRLGHPVVHIALRDAMAFCQWAGCRLPSEAEWEYAARGGLERQAFPWGDVLEPDGKVMSNVWKGNFPDQRNSPNGKVGTVPVKEFSPNEFGLYNMTGNVWEWTADRFGHLHSPRPLRNPTGPLSGNKFVAKGGSYLCHESYCARYRTSSRQALDPTTIADNIGFRIANS